jgi:hypothetical protein
VRPAKTLSRKYPTQKRTDGVAQVVESLPSKCEVLSSTPVPWGKKKPISHFKNIESDNENKILKQHK